MIKAEVIVDNTAWKKKIKNISQLFNKIIKNLPKKYFLKNKITIITVLLSNNSKMKSLNKFFRKRNKPTDILSFPIKKKIDKNFFYLGDIIISFEFMNKPNKINLPEFKKKVAKIFIHGFLHLYGFDHKKNKDFNKMQKEEHKLFNLVKNKI
tara:strand:+ start:1056 stop:1511 length:456 start_codon:yes stop_codon:yes gene_type:complete